MATRKFADNSGLCPFVVVDSQGDAYSTCSSLPEAITDAKDAIEESDDPDYTVGIYEIKHMAYNDAKIVPVTK